jgi:hypothetical protein
VVKKMTNEEYRMTKFEALREIAGAQVGGVKGRMPNDANAPAGRASHSAFELRHSLDIRHPSFVILGRHSIAGISP